MWVIMQAPPDFPFPFEAMARRILEQLLPRSVSVVGCCSS